MTNAAAVDAALARFKAARPAQPTDFQLGAIRSALGKLGDPHLDMGRVVHITGTNGKGSTAQFVRAMAEAAGLRVNVFTSPHLIRVNERIRLGGELVSDEALATALNRVADADAGLSYFEALTGAAYLLFSENEPDLCVIEVGAGGAGDATSVIVDADVCVVTPISRDHEGMFGVSGEAAIARLKAGILRDGRAAVIAEQTAIAQAVLLEEARWRGANAYAAGRNWKASWDGDSFVYEGERQKVRAPWLGIAGQVQAQNAGTACAVIEQLSDERLTLDAMAAGLRGATWPARMQVLGEGPLTRGYDGRIRVDAAHNEAGARTLAAAMLADRNAHDEGPHAPPPRVAVIVAMQESKDAAAMLEAMQDVADDVIACALPPSGGQEGGPGANPAHVAAAAEALDMHALTAGDVREAIGLAKAGGARRIWVFGSVYLCGAVLAANAETVS